MNERILELAERAGAVTFGGKICLFGDQDIEKFAELIVRGCIDIVKQGWINPDEDLIAEEIKQYFGVEE